MLGAREAGLTDLAHTRDRIGGEQLLIVDDGADVVVARHVRRPKVALHAGRLHPQHCSSHGYQASWEC